MRQTKDIYREACGRSHRVLGAYLALQAWKKKVDCVALDRGVSLSFLGLGKMREQRLRWLADDIKDLFPYQEPLQLTGRSTHGSLYLSRKPFPDGAFEDTMPDGQRVKHLSKLGLAAWVARLPSEDRMVATLATAATGGGGKKFVRHAKDTLDWASLAAGASRSEADAG